MKQFNYQKGKLGETIALNFLKKKAYQLIKSNFQTRFGEIDLICAKDKRLIFVEVKLRIGDELGIPEEMINPAKVFQIQKTAQHFLQNNPQLASQYSSYQIDAVCIVLNQDKSIARINHYQNIGSEL